MDEFLENLADYCDKQWNEALKLIATIARKMSKEEISDVDAMRISREALGKMDAYNDIQKKIIQAFKDAGKPI